MRADILIADDNLRTGPASWLTPWRRPTTRSTSASSGKGGVGAAYLAGFEWGINNDYDILVEMDADGSHQPEQLPPLLDATNADLVLGSRWVDGAQGTGPSPELLSRNLWTRIALGMSLGGRDRWRAAARRCSASAWIASPRLATASRSTWPGGRWKAGYRVVEVPITFIEREHGESKMNRAIVAEALLLTTARALRTEPSS